MDELRTELECPFCGRTIIFVTELLECKGREIIECSNCGRHIAVFWELELRATVQKVGG